MKPATARFAIATVSLIWAATAHVEEFAQLKTAGPCSPVIDGVQGDVTVTFNGPSAVGIPSAHLWTSSTAYWRGCSPVINGVQGNVTVTFNDACAVEITPAHARTSSKAYRRSARSPRNCWTAATCSAGRSASPAQP